METPNKEMHIDYDNEVITMPFNMFFNAFGQIFQNKVLVTTDMFINTVMNQVKATLNKEIKNCMNGNAVLAMEEIEQHLLEAYFTNELNKCYDRWIVAQMNKLRDQESEL